MPSSRSRSISFHACRRAAGSKPVVGSSRKTSSGSPQMPSATSSRRRWPPESVFGASVGAVAEPDELEHLLGGPRVRVGGAVELERLARGDLRLQALLLQDDADPLAEGALAPPGIEPEDAQVAGVGAAVALEDLDERGLSGAVGAEDREHLAAADREVDAVERLERAVGLAQPAYGDGRRGERGRRRRSGHFEGVREHAFKIVRARRDSSSADGSNLRLHPRVETARRALHPRGDDGSRAGAYRSAA